MKTKHSVWAAILALLLTGGPGWLSAQTPCASAQLEAIVGRVGLDAVLADGLHYRVAQFGGLPLTVKVEGGEAVHIGYSLFTPWQRGFLDEAQCNFIERLALVADLGEVYGKSFDSYLKEEKIEVQKGSLADLKHYCSDTTFVFQATLLDGKRYVVNFYDGNRRTLTLAYPANYQLILGTTMVEAENHLMTAVSRCQVPREGEAAVADQLLQQVGNGPIHVLTGAIYLLPELNSNRYYVKEGNHRFSLLYSEDLHLETMANLATGTEVEHGLTLAIHLVKYGYRSETVSVPLRQWVAYCLQQGCTPYFGVISQESDRVVCELVMHNEALGYAHVMKFEFDPAMLAARKGSMKARLNSYVPFSNVKSLFDSNEYK